jgi:hypothetical protein
MTSKLLFDVRMSDLEIVQSPKQLDPAAKPDGAAQATVIGSIHQTRVRLMMAPVTKAFSREIKSVCQQVSLPTTLFSPGDGTL